MPLFTRQRKLATMMVLTFAFFLLEIIVGYLTNSVALVADSFHMLSDLMALVIAFYAIRLAKRKRSTKTNSFGFQRAEILGALINGVFLLALCFTLIIEAIQRFFKHEEVENPQLVLIVGGVGLAFNLVGLVLFADVGHGHSHGGGHGHSHGGHGHSHDGEDDHAHGDDHGHSHGDDNDHSHGDDHGHAHGDHALEIKSSSSPAILQAGEKLEDNEEKKIVQLEIGKSYAARKNSPNKKLDSLPFLKGESITVLKHLHNNTYLGTANGVEGKFNARHVRIPTPQDQEQRDPSETAITIETTQPLSFVDPAAQETGDKHAHAHGGGSNMKGVFLHVLGDALGSVGVVIAGLVIWLTDVSWRFYLDPIISLVITFLIIASAVPLVRETSAILLQGVPNFDFEDLKSKLKSIPGVKGIHEVHVWRLADNKLVGSCHIKVGDVKFSSSAATKAKEVFHSFDVHSSTIQTECVANSASTIRLGSDVESGGDNYEDDDKACLLKCDEGCKSTTCCEEDAKDAKKPTH